jgi:putative resolvase
MADKYVSRKIALDALGLSPITLLNLEKNGLIEIIKTPGGHRKYNISKYIRENKKITNNDAKNENLKDNDNERRNICYVRVSTLNQKDDLERQKQYMKERYPTYEIIEDIGSGINFNRKGLRRIIKLAIEGKIESLVIAYKDRLTRFGFELIEDLIKEYSKGEIIIENEKDEKKEPKEELVEDVMQILNVYTAKLNGMRKYGKIK